MRFSKSLVTQFYFIRPKILLSKSLKKFLKTDKTSGCQDSLLDLLLLLVSVAVEISNSAVCANMAKIAELITNQKGKKIKRAKIVYFSKALSIAFTVSHYEIIEEIDDNDNGSIQVREKKV